ncbi:MAG: hypothetical protein CMD07_04835 [Flavobacteriales bacterium]|nr:hypothetical protein [Flavobacteriales bacterium]|tara:strand:+ start:130 stop:2070 length:1941 start_codon:yes stop_codon:yes gene_type:complete
MKKLLFIPCSFIYFFSFSQNFINFIPEKLNKSEKVISDSKCTNQNLQFNEVEHYISTNVPSKYSWGGNEEIIGNTYYDLQTNKSVQNRLYVHENGNISAVWTMSPNTNDGFPERGTGYNFFDGNSWMDYPNVRIETERTGWPSITGLKGGEILASHIFGNPEYHTQISKRLTLGEGNWIESLLPNSDFGSVYDNVWPRMKVGGSNGETIHLISNTYSLDKNYVSYSRSQDGGENWDILDYIIPDIDSNNYNGFGGDAYALDVKDDVVAFVLGGPWTDVILMKSIDNGNTWNKTILREHPIPMFDDSITVDSMNFPLFAGRITNSDQSFSISIDNNNRVHVFYGLMDYSNSNLADDEEGAYSYYPTTNGLMYWSEYSNDTLFFYDYNEDLTDSIMYDFIPGKIITSTLDLNGNGTLDIASIENIAYYGLSLESQPTSVIGENGDIYLAYSGVQETLNELQIEINDPLFNEHYRHIYVMKSEDNGITWTDPFDIMSEVTDPNNGDPLLEGVYPCISNVVDDYVCLTYQRDAYPGLHIQGDLDPIIQNDIIFVKIPITNFNNLKTQFINLPENLINIYPNPSDNFINFNVENFNDSYKVEIFNSIGKTVISKEISNLSNKISIESISPGVYWARINFNDKFITKKFIVK